MDEAELAKWDRSRSLASFHVHAIAMQVRRIRTPISPDDEFVLRPIAEFGFLCVSLIRLRRAAIIAASIPSLRDKIEAALGDYDKAIPGVKKLRDIAEHFDDYILMKGRDKTIPASRIRSGLQVASWSQDSFCWLDVELKFDDCLKAAFDLFFVIKKLVRP